MSTEDFKKEQALYPNRYYPVIDEEIEEMFSDMKVYTAEEIHRVSCLNRVRQ